MLMSNEKYRQLLKTPLSEFTNEEAQQVAQFVFDLSNKESDEECLLYIEGIKFLGAWHCCQATKRLKADPKAIIKQDLRSAHSWFTRAMQFFCDYKENKSIEKLDKNFAVVYRDLNALREMFYSMFILSKDVLGESLYQDYFATVAYLVENTNDNNVRQKVLDRLEEANLNIFKFYNHSKEIEHYFEEYWTYLCDQSENAQIFIEPIVEYVFQNEVHIYPIFLDFIDTYLDQSSVHKLSENLNGLMGCYEQSGNSQLLAITEKLLSFHIENNDQLELQTNSLEKLYDGLQIFFDSHQAFDPHELGVFFKLMRHLQSLGFSAADVWLKQNAGIRLTLILDQGNREECGIGFLKTLGDIKEGDNEFYLILQSDSNKNLLTRSDSTNLFKKRKIAELGAEDSDVFDSKKSFGQ